MKIILFATLLLLASCNVSGITTGEGRLRIYLAGPIAPVEPRVAPPTATVNYVPTVTPTP